MTTLVRFSPLAGSTLDAVSLCERDCERARLAHTLSLSLSPKDRCNAVATGASPKEGLLMGCT